MKASLVVPIGSPRYRPSLPAVLRVRAFALLFAGQAVSLFGDMMFIVALPFAALGITRSPGDLGLVLAAQFLPFALFSLVGGAWADRLERRRVMLASDVARAVVQAVAATLLIAGVARIWHLALLAALYGVADAFFAPASVGFMPAVAGAELLQQGNALVGTVRNGMRLIGTPVAGLLVATLGAGETIAVDAATFLVSAAFLARIRLPLPVRDEHPEPTLRAIAAGWREVRARPWLRSFLGVLLVYHVVVLPCVFVLGPVIAERRLDGATSWGVISGGFGLGAMLGSLVGIRARFPRPMVTCGLAFVVASGQALIIGEGGSTLVIAALQIVTGFAVSTAFMVWETTLGHRIPEATLSRVSSFDFLTSTGSIPLGTAVVGPVAAVLGVRTTMIGATVLSACLAAAYTAQRSVRALR